jgi:hypothetical protein
VAGTSGPGRAEVARAVPRGCRQLRGLAAERLWLEAIGAHEEVLDLRADARANVLEAARQLARRASYSDGTTRRGATPWHLLAGVCLSTWKKIRRRLEAWGFLGTVQPGTTAEFRSVLHRGEPNTAAVYVLCIPKRNARSGHPPARASAISCPPTRSHRDRGSQPQRDPLCKTPENRGGPPCGRTQPGSAAAASAAAPADAVVQTLRKAAGQPISERWCARLAAPFVAAGWTVADLAWAIEHEPGGGRHNYSAAVRHPVGRIRWRLGLHRAGPGGRPLLARSQQLAVSRLHSRQQRARTDALTGRLAAVLELPHGSVAPASQPAVDAAPHAARIRAALGWHSERKVSPVRWIQYKTDTDRKARVNGRPREGQRWQDGPNVGTAWAVPVDQDRLYVLVHVFESAPEANYAIDGEQG